MPQDFPAEVVAQACHAAFMVLQQADKQEQQPSPPWPFLEPEVRANAIAGVRAIRDGITPAENHDRWVTFLQAQGWKPGPKSTRAKRHPLLVPWSELTAAARVKDELFAAIVRALTPSMTRKDGDVPQPESDRALAG